MIVVIVCLCSVVVYRFYCIGWVSWEIRVFIVVVVDVIGFLLWLDSSVVVGLVVVMLVVVVVKLLSVGVMNLVWNVLVIFSVCICVLVGGFLVSFFNVVSWLVVMIWLVVLWFVGIKLSCLR